MIQSTVIFLALIFTLAFVMFVLVSYYVIPNIHEFCQSKLGALHCYKVPSHGS